MKREREKTYCIQHVNVVKSFKQKDYEHEKLLCIRLEVFELFCTKSYDSIRFIHIYIHFLISKLLYCIYYTLYTIVNLLLLFLLIV